MKKYLIIILLIAANSAWAQDELVKDLDGDGVKDTIRIEYVQQIDTTLDSYSYIACHLSSRQFKEVQSRKITIDYWGFPEIRSSITATKNGFEFFVRYTRDGDKAQFRYNKQAGKMQLIGMSRYDIGTADGDGKGKSSVNLLTNKYVGDWYAVDYNLDKLFKIPTIRTKMDLGTIYLEEFDNETISDYAERCSSIRYEHKIKTVSTG